jgi:hypothetical protein
MKLMNIKNNKALPKHILYMMSLMYKMYKSDLKFIDEKKSNL